MSVLVNAMRTETEIREEIEALRNLTTAQLKEKYREVFGEETRSNHKQFLFRRIAWRMQANAWGGLSERAGIKQVMNLFNLAPDIQGQLLLPESSTATVRESHLRRIVSLFDQTESRHGRSSLQSLSPSCGVQAANGRCTRNVAPWLGPLATLISPPCCSTIHLAIESPSPAPPSHPRALSAR